jgi:uncharacterized protein (TIGR02186 family)
MGAERRGAGSGCRGHGRAGMGQGAVALLLAAIVVAVGAVGQAAGNTKSMTVAPSEVGIDLFYHGTALRVSGMIPAAHQAAVLCVGKGSTIKARRKGRVWGVLWMNTGDVTFEEVPSVYLLATSAPLAELAAPAALAALGLGFEALEPRAFAAGGPDDADARFRELVRLNEQDGLWGLEQGAVRLEPGKGGNLTATAEIYLPARATPGGYEVRLYSFRDGTGRLEGSTVVTLRSVGVAGFVSAMARQRGLLYGIVSALVAMAAGLLAGLVFGRGRRRGH